MDRRSFLSAITIGIVGGAGCLGRGEAGIRLAYLSLSNDRDERHSADVEIEDSGELVYSDTVQLLPGGDGDITIEDPVHGPGQYVVSVRADGRSRAVDLLQQVSAGQDCVGVRFTLTRDGSLEEGVTSPEEC